VIRVGVSIVEKVIGFVRGWGIRHGRARITEIASEVVFIRG
jgi:hypothetical protein